MEEKKQVSPIWVFIIAGVISALIGPLCFYLGMQLVKDDNEGTNTLTNNVLKNNNTDKYNAYSVGEIVTLKDGSKWNVLSVSAQNEEYITLLNRENINADFKVKFNDAVNYLNNTYKTTLENALSIEVPVIRLLSLNDISVLSGISVSDLVPGASIENSITPNFLYLGQTITDAVDQNCPIMICTNPAGICIGTQTYTFEIRPVITISKSVIK